MSRDTYVDPALLLHFRGIILGLGAIDRDPLARRGEVIGAAKGWPLPVLHFGNRGRTGGGRGGRGSRHQTAAGERPKSRRDEALGRVPGAQMRLQPKSRPVTDRAGDHPADRECVAL